MNTAEFLKKIPKVSLHLHLMGSIQARTVVDLAKKHNVKLLAGLLRPGINHDGIPLGPDGLPTGELKGPEAMTLVGQHVGFDREVLANDEPGLRRFAKLCVRRGVTTATDLANLLPDDAVAMMRRVSGEARYPVRVMSFRRFQGITPRQAVDHALALAKQSTDRLRPSTRPSGVACRACRWDGGGVPRGNRLIWGT